MPDVELNRREVVTGMLAAGGAMLMPEHVAIAAGALPLAGPAASAGVARVHADLRLQINGEQHRLSAIDVNTTLLDCLRDRLHLTGSKKGCGLGQCGACTVLVDGRRINSCLLLVVMLEGKEITTIEGLAKGDELHPLQTAFIQHDAFQCGYCTPGQIISGVACIAEGHAGSDDKVREWMSSNLCRCGAYPNIVAAVREVARQTGAKAS